ncbi:putative cytochrome b561 [Aphelenchoides bicaudatus]|nr:putative cytochrome b561 [Aphelenchoides bicaudatus]
MGDSALILRPNNVLIKESGSRVPSRLKHLRNSDVPTGDVSFASIYSAHGHESAGSVSSSNIDMVSLFSFDFFVGISQCFLIAFAAMMAYVFGSTSHVIQYDNNQVISQRTNNMDFMSLLYVIGLVISQGEALVVYRVHRHELKFISHLLHSLLHIAGLTFAILLLVSMIQHQNLNGETYFATFHAWISLILVAGFIVQSLFTFVDLVFPRHTRPLRSNFNPSHKVYGISLFIVSVLLIVTGMQQYTGVLGECYNKFNCPRSLAAILNSSILCLIGYTITITVLVTNTQWERKPTIDEKTKL